MQKQVSKHSLLTLALSLLLVVSLGLTATFAAFSGSNTISGTVYFNGSVSVATSGSYRVDTVLGAAQTVTVTSTAATFTVTANGMTYGWNVVMTLPDNITLTESGEGASVVTGSMTGASAPEVTGAHEITWTSNANVTASDGQSFAMPATITITNANVTWAEFTNNGETGDAFRYTLVDGASAVFTATTI